MFSTLELRDACAMQLTDISGEVDALLGQSFQDGMNFFSHCSQGELELFLQEE